MVTKKNKILILGVTGFVGRNLKEYLERLEAYELLCPSHAELDLLAEKQVEDYLCTHKPDVVIDAAVCRNPKYYQNDSPGTELEQDLRMFFNLEKYHAYYGKMLYFGSGAELDKRMDICSAKEDAYPNGVPANDYGFAKYVIGRNIENSDNIFNLRLYGLFGKYENWRTTFISGACCKAIKGLPITIRQNVIFDYLYIDDFCRIIQWFIEHKPRYHTYNIASGRKVDLVTIAETVKRLSRKDIPIIVCKDGFGNEYTADISRLKDEYENLVIEGLDDSVRKLLSYYRSIESEIDLVSLLY